MESAEHVLFDHEFTKLFKKLEGKFRFRISYQLVTSSRDCVTLSLPFTNVLRHVCTAAVTRAVEETPGEQVVSTNHVNGKMKQDLENHESIVASYKELIREQVTCQ